MLKRNKQLIIGFILGAMLFSIIPVGAAVQDYILQRSAAKVIVDGKEYNNRNLPILNWRDYNYIPAATFREISESLGVGFEWVGGKNEIQIDTRKALVGEEKNSDMENTTKKGVTIIDDVEYISLLDVIEFSNRYSIIPDREQHTDETDKGLFIKYTGETNMPDRYDILLKDVPLVKIENSPARSGYPYFVEYQYFEKNILPLIK